MVCMAFEEWLIPRIIVARTIQPESFGDLPSVPISLSHRTSLRIRALRFVVLERGSWLTLAWELSDVDL